MWSADITIARQEKTHFGLSGRYLYHYRLRRGGTTVTEWFTDPFAYATNDVGALAAFDTPDSTAPYAWHDDTWKVPELRHFTSLLPTNGGAKRPVSSGSSTPATPPNINRLSQSVRAAVRPRGDPLLAGGVSVDGFRYDEAGDLVGADQVPQTSEPLATTLSDASGIPMLWQEQEFTDNYVLPPDDDPRPLPARFSLGLLL